MNQTMASKKVLSDSQKEIFPYEMSVFGLNIQVNEGVFSPKYFNGWHIFTKNFPDVSGKDVLEVGTGTGITALYLAKNGANSIVAVDINSDAVKNTKVNVKKNKLDKIIDTRESDIFSKVKKGEVFDVIYWNMPFMPANDDYQYSSDLERSLFDPGYKLTDRFLKEARNYLKENGSLIIGTGEGGFADIPKLMDIIKKYRYRHKLLIRKKSSEINPVYFRMYELTF
jgi:HemK-related putative methylase